MAETGAAAAKGMTADDWRALDAEHAESMDMADALGARGPEAVAEAVNGARVPEPGNARSSAPDMSILSAGRSVPAVLPPKLFASTWGLISDIAEGTCAPVDYVGFGLLAAAASLVGGKRKVTPWAGWEEPCILWLAAVGDPSSNKSPALDATLAPLRDMEAEHAERHKGTLRGYDMLAERAAAELKAWKADVEAARKAGEETPEKPASADVPDEPQRRRLMVMDATPEAVGVILSGNRFGTLMFRDELAGWIEGFDRYSPGGRSFWVEAYGGRVFSIDRKSNPVPLVIPFNGVSVVGGLQPERLAECLLKGADDGLVPRFLWAWPDQVPFRRPRQVADTERLARILRALDDLPPGRDRGGEPVPIVLPLSVGAADIFERWCQEHQSGESDAASLFKGFCGKARGMVLRLALAAELLAWADGDGDEPREVSAGTIAAAIEFMEDYAKPTARRVFGDAALPPAERNAAILARYILKMSLARLNARDLRRTPGLPPSLKDSAALDEAIVHLVEAEWLAAAGERAGETPGRARKDFTVNPAVHVGDHG